MLIEAVALGEMLGEKLKIWHGMALSCCVQQGPGRKKCIFFLTETSLLVGDGGKYHLVNENTCFSLQFYHP